ncbi:MAG: hypothetical protein U1C70_02420 [Sediminibacterium sp.]|uniref:hypothetical protein n=1 Tax=Sediminibacterium sp. TaxID=1917865 RepID=UPI002AB8ACEF|nr:hypothetical protein [Sediminibacterium sp.]MDZ4070655.1 hypothetical protein [Sediminibacterium sp.]
MLDTSVIMSLKTRLLSLGFDGGMEEKLMSRMCFSEDSFLLHFNHVNGNDSCHYSVKVEKTDKEGYDIPYFIAVLRKGIMLNELLKPYDRKMEKINWLQIAEARGSSKQIVVPLEMIQEATLLLKELAGIEDSTLILYKYWVDTPLEALVPNLSAIKARQEISQRFYVVDEVHTISAQEAFKFLQNRWVEKKFHLQRQLLATASDPERKSSIIHGAGKKKKKPAKK